VTTPDVHLAEDAVAAYVDGVLSPTAADRAERHLRACRECRVAIEAQREAKAVICAAADPQLPTGLLAKLLEVPMTADLGGGDMVLALDGDQLAWAPTRGAAAPVEPRVVERSRTAPLLGTVAAVAALPAAGRRPAGTDRPAGRAGENRVRPTAPEVSASRPRRSRRGLALSLAGLAFGVIASAAATTGAGTAAPARPGLVPGPSPAGAVVRPSSPMQASVLGPPRSTPTLVTTRRAR
jgi:hypothetical protein